MGYAKDKVCKLKYNLTSVTLYGGEKLTYEYDELGRKSKLIYPDNKYVTYGYDNLNRLTSVVTWKTEKTFYSYDKSSTLKNGKDNQVKSNNDKHLG